MSKKNNQNQGTGLQFETVSPATKLLEKRRKMYEVHEAFEAQKEEFKKKEEIFQRQEDAIRERDLQMQDYLIKFCNFLSDNDAKKQRAERRFIEEKKTTEQRENDIKELNNQYNELVKHQMKLQQKLDQLKKYEEYLETVCRAYPDQYKDISEILHRYNTLVKNNDTLQKENKEKNSELDQLKQEMFSYEKSRNHEILQLSNEVKELTQKLEDKEIEKIQIQQKVDVFTNETSAKNLNLGKILLAIDNLYSRCSQDVQTKFRHGITNSDEKDKKELKNKTDKKKYQLQQQQQQNNKDIYDEDNYYKKTELARAKLKALSLYMIDFKVLIDECKKEKSNKQNTKKQP